MSQFYNNAVFWIEVDKIDPNPYQPRKEFNQEELESLSDSIRQYGVLQALVVTRKEEEKEDGGLQARYELISGERRLRASKLAGIREVPVLIRSGEENNKMKLELAIIENVQREDLNVVDRAQAFKKLVDEFGLSHAQVAKRVGKSREYVSNSLRILVLPEHIVQALSEGKLSEGHARPLGMLSDRPEEQETLFKEILYKKISVREAERIARRIAYDKVRKKDTAYDPRIVELEETLSESFGTRVHIERKSKGGKISIEFFSDDDLDIILARVKERGSGEKHDPNDLLLQHIERSREAGIDPAADEPVEHKSVAQAMEELSRERELRKEQKAAEKARAREDAQKNEEPAESVQPAREESQNKETTSDSGVPEASDTPTQAEPKESEDLYSIKHFSI